MNTNLATAELYWLAVDAAIARLASEGVAVERAAPTDEDFEVVERDRPDLATRRL